MKLTHRISIAAVACVLFKFVIAGVKLKLGDVSFEFSQVDAMTIAAILTPCLGAPHLESWVATKGAAKDDT